MNIGCATSPIAPPIAPEEAMVVEEEVDEAEEAVDGGAAVGERVKSTAIAALCGVLGAVRRTLPAAAAAAAADPAVAAVAAVDDDGDVDGAVDVDEVCGAVGCEEGSEKLSVLGAEEVFDERFVAPVRRPPRPRPRLPSIVRRERGGWRDRGPALLPPPPVPPPVPPPPPRPRLLFWCAGRGAPRPAAEATRLTTVPDDATRSMTSLRVLAGAEEEDDDDEEEGARSGLEGEAAAAAAAVARESCSRLTSFCSSNDVMEARARMEEGDRDARTNPTFARSSCVEKEGACSTLTAPPRRICRIPRAIRRLKSTNTKAQPRI